MVSPLHLYRDCRASHEEDDDGGDDEDENQDGHPQPLLLVCRVQLVSHNLADAALLGIHLAALRKMFENTNLL